MPPSRLARRRQLSYAAALFGLFAAFFWVRGSSLRMDGELHTLAETVATLLALVVGAVGLVRFYSRKDNAFLFISVGFLATALLDGYHAVVTSRSLIDGGLAASQSLGAWSWLVSRLFMSLFLWLSWVFWRRERIHGAAGRVHENLVLGVGLGLGLSCIALLTLAVAPPAYFPGLHVSRPQELLPACFFLLALVGYLRKGRWTRDPLEHWLILALIAGFVGQALFISTSRQPYDAMFSAAHLLKCVSYSCVLVGLLFDMQRLFNESTTQEELRLKNAILTTQQEASLDGILVVDEHSRIVSHNERFVELFGLRDEDLLEGDESVLSKVVAQTERPEAFLERVRELYENKGARSREEFCLNDGRVLDRYSSPMTREDGRYLGRVWFFRDITERAKAAQEVAALQTQLREQAIRDPLTGLHNRRHLEAAFDRELARARRGGRPLSVVLGDIDHFKRVNDTHGHAAGDDVLKAFAALLVRHTRSSDVACRYGGEEFLALLPEMGLESAVARAEKLRLAVQTEPIRWADTAIRVTASFGVATFPEHGATAEALIGAADSALYAAKASGRNLVKSWALPALDPQAQAAAKG